MQLTPFCVMLSCLRVSPDRSQFFRYDSISLSCEDQLNSTGWKVKRKTPQAGVRPCSYGWGSASSSSTCIIRNTYPSDSGVYWCESEDGERSNGVNITITDRTVILESPALPVSEGAAVILRCKPETNSSDHRFDFYKDGRSISSNSKGEMTIHGALKSDEGLYTCSVSGGGESVGSWLAVEGGGGGSSPSTAGAAGATGATGAGALAALETVDSSDSEQEPSASFPPTSSAPSSSSVSVSRLMCHLVVGTPYLLSTILLGLIYRDRKRAAQMVAERRGSNDVIMEVVV